MAGKRFLIIGGAFIALYGVLFLFTGIGLWQKNPHVEMIILPSCLIAAGVFGVLSGALDGRFLFITNYVGLKVSILFALLQGSASVADKGFITPYYSMITSLFNRELSENSPFYWIIVLVFAVFIHIFLTGIEAAEDNDWDSFIITRSVTRLIFILVLGIFFNNLFAEALVREMSILSYATCFCVFFVAFEMIRSHGDHNSSVKMVIMTILCVPAFILILALTIWFGGIVNWICNLTVVIPIIVITLALILIGHAHRTTGSSATVGYRGKDALGNPQYRYTTDKGTFANNSNGTLRKLSNEQVLMEDLGDKIEKLEEEIKRL
jgi:hypothetical protein